MSDARRLLVVAGLLLASPARAQTPELDRARATFAEALADENAGRSAVALEKFRRVAVVRDTAPVEYRIATCLEALGKRAPAVAAYDRAVHLGRGDPASADVVAAANARITALAEGMGKLAVEVHGSDVPEVRVDGKPVARGELGALLLEPGDHAVDVTAPGTKPAQAKVSIERGRALRLSVELAPAPPLPPTPTSHLRRDVGLGLLGLGAALGLGAGVTLLVRSSLIDSIHATCPNDVCPLSSHDDIEQKRALASSLELPAALLGGVGLAAVVVGAVLVALRPTKRVIAWLAPSSRGGMFVLRGTF